MLCGVWNGPSVLLPGVLGSYIALDDDLHPRPMTPPSEAPSHLPTCFKAIVTLPGDRHEAMGPTPQAPGFPEDLQEGPAFILAFGPLQGGPIQGTD